MNLIVIYGQCKDILPCELITIVDLLEKFDFYYNHIQSDDYDILIM